jgi:hypothetical protein
MLYFLVLSLPHLFPSVAVSIAPHYKTPRPIISPATPLELAVPMPPASAHSKADTDTRFPLESAFTKKQGGGGGYR